MSRDQASSFDPELFDEVQKAIESFGATSRYTPVDLEDHIAGETAKTEEERNLLNGQFCYEFINHPLWPLYTESLRKMVEREHRKFEEAERDPDDHLRRTWKAYQSVVSEIISNVQRAADYYRSSIQ
jgi:hypothetical protein